MQFVAQDLLQDFTTRLVRKTKQVEQVMALFLHCSKKRSFSREITGLVGRGGRTGFPVSGESCSVAKNFFSRKNVLLGLNFRLQHQLGQANENGTPRTSCGTSATDVIT